MIKKNAQFFFFSFTSQPVIPAKLSLARTKIMDTTGNRIDGYMSFHKGKKKRSMQMLHRSEFEHCLPN